MTSQFVINCHAPAQGGLDAIIAVLGSQSSTAASAPASRERPWPTDSEREKIAIASAIASFSLSGRSKDHVMPGMAMLVGGGGLGGKVLYPSGSERIYGSPDLVAYAVGGEWRNISGSLAKFAAMRRASSLASSLSDRRI